MSRYIDFDYVKTKKRFNMKSGHHFVWMQDIYSAPSIDIVRCGECKHFHKEGIIDESYYCKQFHDRNGYWREVNPDDFCSYGEREGE